MLNHLKDAVSGRAARSYLGHALERYGEVHDLRIDSGRRQISIVGTPHGETTPVTVDIERYTLEQRNGELCLRVEACSCSRPWIQTLLRDFACQRPFPLPSWAAAAL